MAVVDVVGDVRSMAWCRLLSGSMLAILLDLKHETLDYENTSPQLFRWGPHLTSPLCEEGVGGGAAEWRDVDGCPAAGWPSPLYTRSETRSTN